MNKNTAAIIAASTLGFLAVLGLLKLKEIKTKEKEEEISHDEFLLKISKEETDDSHNDIELNAYL
ncbi:hypothetical protein [Elizabethkingia sp. JS20170427COW]|uniref:hypothetical protein n=1 Tax=Elizabethkingia sp. JS20170427COW TaxID=2583851 RepID=UPI001110717C|nr:hypothetical protein [Elizabethkingia sp. JS20170427COW]QCX53175.1 hypothetical protein FGE20_05265 [Elizabethkingia sp. JS20170427COW]